MLGNALLKVWLGLGIKNTWLGKRYVLAKKKYPVLSAQTRMENVPKFRKTIPVCKMSVEVQLNFKAILVPSLSR